MRVLALLLVSLLATASWSTSIVEIDNSEIQRGFIFDNDSRPFQTIEVTESGRLVGLDFWLLDFEDRGVQIGPSSFALSTEDGTAIAGRALHSRITLEDGRQDVGVEFDSSGTREFSFEFPSSTVLVQQGDNLRLAFRNNNFIYVAGNKDEYPGGNFQVSCGGDGCSHPVDYPENGIPSIRIIKEATVLDPYDVAFRLYIETPEPAIATLAMLSCLILARRSRPARG